MLGELQTVFWKRAFLLIALGCLLAVSLGESEKKTHKQLTEIHEHERAYTERLLDKDAATHSTPQRDSISERNYGAFEMNESRGAGRTLLVIIMLASALFATILHFRGRQG